MNAPDRAQALTLELETPVDDHRPVYLSGNFNNWALDEERFRMRKTGHGKYIFTFPPHQPLPPKLEYKYIRGGWENKELDVNGNTTNNRTLENKQGLFVRDFVPRWLNYGMPYNPAFLPKIITLADDYHLHPIDRTRRIRVLLPHDYDRSLDRYPVLYMHDAQNLFDEKSPYGNWAIDQQLAVLTEKGMGGIIVVAVDHGGPDRIREFLPVGNRRFGPGEGRDWVKFLAGRLKPDVDRLFRTLPQRQFTGVGGSSLAGLVSIYAGIMFAEVFGRLLIFSPSLWAARNSQFDVDRFYQPQPTRIYFYAGGKEGVGVAQSARDFKKAIGTTRWDGRQVKTKISIDRQGRHSENYWGVEFPKAVEWLFFKK